MAFVRGNSTSVLINVPMPHIAAYKLTGHLSYKSDRD